MRGCLKHMNKAKALWLSWRKFQSPAPRYNKLTRILKRMSRQWYEVSAVVAGFLTGSQGDADVVAACKRLVRTQHALGRELDRLGGMTSA